MIASLRALFAFPIDFVQLITSLLAGNTLIGSLRSPLVTILEASHTNSSLRSSARFARRSSAKKLDSNNTSVGTPYYVAPEVFRGDLEYGVKADVYSFGVLLGVCLYHGSVSDFFFWDRARKLSGYVVSQRVLSGWRPKFKPIFEENLPTVVELIKRCWLNEPSERPTMKEVRSCTSSTSLDIGANITTT